MREVGDNIHTAKPIRSEWKGIKSPRKRMANWIGVRPIRLHVALIRPNHRRVPHEVVERSASGMMWVGGRTEPHPTRR